MKFETDEILTVTEANQNFSRVTRTVDRHGRAVIFKNSRPKYVVYDLTAPRFEPTEDEMIDLAGARVMKKYRAAFEELAK